MIYKSVSISKNSVDRKKSPMSIFTQECLSIVSCIFVGFVFIIFCCSNTPQTDKVENSSKTTITQTQNITPKETKEITTDDKQTSETTTQNTNTTQEIKFSEPIPAWSQNISSHFGDREDPINGGAEYHKGLDIAMPQGTPIKAVFDGTVTISEENSPSYGKYIEITHSDTLKTRYAHCSELKVKNGDKIKQGDVIALVGSTGNSTGPHLHLEVIENNVKVDPEKYLK